ncbi:MAG: hypothetical protein HGA65_05475 [Oscillochloris sp.]|nr:hypothetical protein [Oscillochloris sp.]
MLLSVWRASGDDRLGGAALWRCCCDDTLDCALRSALAWMVADEVLVDERLRDGCGALGATCLHLCCLPASDLAEDKDVGSLDRIEMQGGDERMRRVIRAP